MRLLTACLMLVSPLVHAGGDPTALDRWSVGAGTFDNTFQIKGRVDGAVENQGSLIDFDERFGFDRTRLTQLYEFQYLLAERHQIELRHYSDERTRSAAIDDVIEFEGETFPAQASLRGSAGFAVSEVSYAYWWRTETRTPWAAQLGAVRLRGKLGLSGRVEIEDIGESEGAASVRERVDAPVVGVAVRHAFNQRWRWFATTRLIYLDLGKLEGYAYTARVGVEWFPTRHLGLELQYGQSAWNAEKAKGAFNGELEVGFRGPQLLLKLRG